LGFVVVALVDEAAAALGFLAAAAFDFLGVAGADAGADN